MKYTHPIHPPHALWLRKCCNRHLWPEVRLITMELAATGETRPDALKLLDDSIASFNALLSVAESNGEGSVLVVPPEGMHIQELLARVNFAIAEWKYERERAEG